MLIVLLWSSLQSTEISTQGAIYSASLPIKNRSQEKGCRDSKTTGTMELCVATQQKSASEQGDKGCQSASSEKTRQGNTPGVGRWGMGTIDRHCGAWADQHITQHFEQESPLHRSPTHKKGEQWQPAATEQPTATSATWGKPRGTKPCNLFPQSEVYAHFVAWTWIWRGRQETSKGIHSWREGRSQVHTPWTKSCVGPDVIDDSGGMHCTNCMCQVHGVNTTVAQLINRMGVNRRNGSHPALGGAQTHI